MHCQTVQSNIKLNQLTEIHMEHIRNCDTCMSCWVDQLGSVPDQVTAFIKNTSLDPCQALQTRLIGGIDDDLLQEHADHCKPCGELVAALDWADNNLTALREDIPDPNFVATVIAVTSGSRPWWSTMMKKLSQLAMRPRFALEASFVMSIVLFPFVGDLIEHRLTNIPTDTTPFITNQIQQKVQQAGILSFQWTQLQIGHMQPVQVESPWKWYQSMTHSETKGDSDERNP
ncbi:MAG: hypothetical protein KDC35_19345 [Acidobacteria bacterium]|nr:hypothetical protein [Acidobacteriota bacterium]